METKITRLDDFGRGVTRINDKVCFVKNALSEEIVDIDVIKEKKKYQIGKVNSYITKSDKRITPKCKYYDVCGGCNLEHISLEEENNFKKEKVEKILEKFASKKVKVNKIASEDEYGYRNKITLRVDNGRICLLEEESNNLVEIDECILAENKINEIIKELKEIVKDEKDISKIMIRVSNNLERVMIKVDGKVNDVNLFKEISDSLIINDKVIKEEYLLSNILDKKFLVSSDSFFQVNRKITEMMYRKIIETVKENKPNKVLDLYCGVGTIGICVSSYTNNVLGVEVVEKAVESANKNKELNKVGNIDFKCGKVENIIDNSYSTYDLIIVDPPRSGLDKKVVEVLNRSNSKTIVYVSCDPITLARDIKLLDNYEIKEVELFNMFPRTYHVETVSVLCRKKH